MSQPCQPLPTMGRNLAAPLNQNSVLSTIHLRHDISAFPGYGISLRRSTSCSYFLLARHSWRPCSGPPLYDCIHSTVLDTNSNVRLPPRLLGSQHPGDVKCGPQAYRDTTIIRLRYPARYPSDHPIAYCDKQTLNTGIHLECSASDHIPFCDLVPLRYPQLRSAHCDDLSR